MIPDMAIFVNSQTKSTYEDHVPLPEDGKIHDAIVLDGTPGIMVDPGKAW